MMLDFRVTGRVQGVGFRYHTAKEAKRLSLRGWVRNALDGSVEGQAAGSRQSLDEFRESLGKGPSSSKVDQAEVKERRGEVQLPSVFEVRD